MSPLEVIFSLELLFAPGDIWLCFIFYLLLEGGALFPLAVHPNSAETTRFMRLFLSSSS